MMLTAEDFRSLDEDETLETTTANGFSLCWKCRFASFLCPKPIPFWDADYEPENADGQDSWFVRNCPAFEGDRRHRGRRRERA